MSKYDNVEIDRITAQLKALANSHRLQIFLGLLSFCSPGATCCSDISVKKCVGEIGKRLSISPSTVSHHMKELRQAGLIHMERHGKTMECCVRPEACGVLSKLFVPWPIQGGDGRASKEKKNAR